MKTPRLTPAIALCSTILLSGQAAAAEQRIGFSDRLGVDVIAKGEPWCKAQLDIEVRLRKDSTLVSDPQGLAAFIPRLKGPIEGECPRAEQMTVGVIGADGAAVPGHQPLQAAKANGWVAAAMPSKPSDQDEQEQGNVAPNVAAASPSSPAPADAPQPAELSAAQAPAPTAGASVFDQAKEAQPEDWFLFAIRYDPSLADLTKNPDSAWIMADLYACEALRKAGGNEFDRRAVFDAMQIKAADLLTRSKLIDKLQFKIQYRVELDNYDFDRGGFPFKPFRVDLNGIRHVPENSRCNNYNSGGLPYTYGMHFTGADGIDLLPMKADEAKDFTSRRTNRFGSIERTILITAVIRPTGMDFRYGIGILQAEPVAFQVEDQVSRRVLWSVNEDDMSRHLAEAKAAAEAAERQRQQAVEAARQAAEAEQRRRLAESMKSRLALIDDRVARLNLVHGKGSAIIHPSLAAAKAKLSGKPEAIALIFKAGGDGNKNVPVAWPRHLRLSSTGLEDLREGAWYFALAEIMPDNDGVQADGLMPAVGDIFDLLPCHEEACAEADDTEALIQQWISLASH